jgi:hypothetical protein
MAAGYTIQKSAQGGFDILDADSNVVAHDDCMYRAVEVAFELDQGLKPISATPVSATPALAGVS